MLLVVAVLGLAGCISDDPVDETGSSGDASFIGGSAAGDDEMAGDTAGMTDDGADIDDAPVVVDIDAEFVDGPCEFTPPPGTSPRCGTVTVPEDWATDSGQITLSVAVFPSTAATPAPDPVVFLDGGPGSNPLDAAVFRGSDIIDPLRASRDLIMFDQRGAGRSDPALDCPEITELTRELEDAPNVDPDEAEGRFGDALSACSTRLTAEGIDLDAYTTVNNAHDTEAIRVALGYEPWNLLGISYGTRLGLEVMRQHPEGVRAAVLDSVFPPQVDSVVENPATFLASFDAVVEACAAEPECAAAGPLDERLIGAVQAYEAEPVPVEIRNFITGETDEVFVDGNAIVGIVTQALYSPEAFGDLPELVAELEQGQTEAVSSFLTLNRTNEEVFTDGMFYAVVCNDEIPFANPTEVVEALPEDPFGLDDRFDLGSNTGRSAFTTCAAFDPVGPADEGGPPAVANEPVASDIPALVMAGRFDPVTPVAWSEAAAETLTNSFLVVDPSNSHGISPGTCGMSIVNAFLDAPEIEPDTSCIGADAVSFLAPVDRPVSLEPLTITAASSGRELETVRPSGWVDGGLGDVSRGASFLDPTALIQLADNPAVELGVELFLDQQYGVILGPSVDAEPFGDRAWTRRSGQTGSTAVEWYETEIDGVNVAVLLVSTPAELEANVDSVLRPALEQIDVRS